MRESFLELWQVAQQIQGRDEVELFSHILLWMRHGALVIHSSRQAHLVFLPMPTFFHIIHGLEAGGKPNTAVEDQLEARLHMRNRALSNVTCFFILYTLNIFFVVRSLDMIRSEDLISTDVDIRESNDDGFLFGVVATASWCGGNYLNINR